MKRLKFTLVEQDLTLDKNDSDAEVLNNFFINVVSNLNFPKYHEKSVDIDHTEDPIARSIEQFKNQAEIEKEILNLDSSKACQDSDIPTKVI